MTTLATVIGKGAIGSRPAAASAGRLYFSTEPKTYRDNGSSWDDVSDAGTAGNLTGDVTSVGLATTIGAGKVTEAMQVLANNTTGNVSTSKHGYVPILPNDATKYLDGTGAYTVPAGGGGGGSVPVGKMYSTGSDAAWASSSSGSTADIDATNGSLAVTVPASGQMVVTIDLDFSYGTANNGGFIVLRTGSTDLQAMSCISGNVASGGIGAVSASAGHFHGTFYVTGLTPGALTLKAGFRRLGSTVLNVYANDGSGAAGHLAGPFVMAAWQA